VFVELLTVMVNVATCFGPQCSDFTKHSESIKQVDHFDISICLAML